MLRFVRGRRTGISSATARNSRHHRIATRAVFTQRTPQRHAHRMASLVLSRTRTHLPAPHGKAPSFLSFPPMILGAHPVSRLQPASRALTRTRALRAPQSVSEKSLHLFTHLAYFTIAQRIKGEDFIIFFFTSLVPWRHPKVKNFRRVFSHKNGPKWGRIRGEQNGESKGEGKKQKPSPLNSSRSTFCDRSVKE